MRNLIFAHVALLVHVGVSSSSDVWIESPKKKLRLDLSWVPAESIDSIDTPTDFTEYLKGWEIAEAKPYQTGASSGSAPEGESTSLSGNLVSFSPQMKPGGFDDAFGRILAHPEWTIEDLTIDVKNERVLSSLVKNLSTILKLRTMRVDVALVIFEKISKVTSYSSLKDSVRRKFRNRSGDFVRQFAIEVFAKYCIGDGLVNLCPDIKKGIDTRGEEVRVFVMPIEIWKRCLIEEGRERFKRTNAGIRFY